MFDQDAHAEDTSGHLTDFLTFFLSKEGEILTRTKGE
jgi:hypothetical protein